MIKTSFQYHHHTSYDRHKMTSHYLDWQNQPVVYKDYPGIDPVLLPQDLRIQEKKLSHLLRDMETSSMAHEIDVEKLSLILHLTYSLTAKTPYSRGDLYYRSTASAGALYPTEIYVATHGVHGLEDGLLHFALHHHGLSTIRTQELSHYIVRFTKTPDQKIPILTFFLTAILFRSAWKYRDRSYRYHLLDTGHVAENLILAMKALQLRFHLSYDFDDSKVNYLLGLNEGKEIALAVACVLGPDSVSNLKEEDVDRLPEDIRNASRVAENEIDYPVIKEIHGASSQISSKRDYESSMIHELGLNSNSWEKILPPDPWPEVMNYPEAVFNRRSRRNFVKQAIPSPYIMALLDSLCLIENTDYQQTICIGFLASHIEDLASGFYLLDTDMNSMGLVAPGSFVERMAHVCLDQVWLSNAAIHFLFLGNLELLDRTWGMRGYRYAMMTAGRLGERLYIAATAMGLGCCGIGAFYDPEAVELLGLNNASRLLYLVAVGRVKNVIGLK